jgi:hypothetical protein
MESSQTMSNNNCACIIGCFQCCPYTEYISNTNYSRIPRYVQHEQRKYPKQNKRVRRPFKPHQKRPDYRVPNRNKLYCISCQWTVVDGECSVSCHDPNYYFL